MKSNETYRIRPASRHLFTIGEDLIQDEFAAIIELVKNAYDADSPDVLICFSRGEDNSAQIKIIDHGHGMTKEDIVEKWLVPSTTNKNKKRISPLGRIMQGRKGIGRYAANILGEDLMLETVSVAGQKTSLYIKWQDFLEFNYLDEIEIAVKSEQSTMPSGTTLTINVSESKIKSWDEYTFHILTYELKKLVPPNEENSFCIKLLFDNFFEDKEKNKEKKIEPFPILDLFDYKISGSIDSAGRGRFEYKNQKIVNTGEEIIESDFGPTGCGSLNIDIRVYDRDKDSISELILRGLKDEETEQYVSKMQARHLLDSVNGIGVYRNGFRIRPLGDPDFDWLQLNAQRVQNPSLKIGSNQVVGYIHVESEELSSLDEKSARDGIKNNKAYQNLIDLTQKVILLLEQRRYIFRRSLDLSKSNKKIETQLEKIYNLDELEKSVCTSLEKAGLSKETISDIAYMIQKEQISKSNMIENIKRSVAIYQKQATLGKIIDVILHEGRRPLNYLKNQIPNLQFYVDIVKKDQNPEYLAEIVSITEGVSDNTIKFVDLFNRIDPLSAKRREREEYFKFESEIQKVLELFKSEFDRKKIDILLKDELELSIYGWNQDIFTIFANLIDNSIYWIDEKKCENREIRIETEEGSDYVKVHYYDSGPGISKDLIESEVIFEPNFTTKTGGTGLGLAIAGESAIRNKWSLQAFENDEGAYFCLTIDKRKDI